MARSGVRGEPKFRSYPAQFSGRHKTGLTQSPQRRSTDNLSRTFSKGKQTTPSCRANHWYSEMCNLSHKLTENRQKLLLFDSRANVADLPRLDQLLILGAGLDPSPHLPEPFFSSFPFICMIDQWRYIHISYSHKPKHQAAFEKACSMCKGGGGWICSNMPGMPCCSNILAFVTRPHVET